MNQNFSIFLFKQVYLYTPKFFHNSSCTCRTHYDTLNLQKNCTQKEIRNSFIKLSKENHPDVNKSPTAHKEFLKIQEAYSILSKPSSRINYDLSLAHPGSYGQYGNAYPFSARAQSTAYQRNPWNDPSFYHNRDRSKDAFYKDRPYYGIKGLKKQPNGVVAMVVVFTAFIVFVVQMSVIRYAIVKQQVTMNQRSREAQMLLNEIRERAEKNGTQAQLEIHKIQFEEMQNRQRQP